MYGTVEAFKSCKYFVMYNKVGMAATKGVKSSYPLAGVVFSLSKEWKWER